MGQASFSAAVSAWVTETKERMDAVRKEAAKRTVAIMQTPVGEGGRMRVDTGFLRWSLQAQLGMGSFTPRDKPVGVEKFTYDPGDVNLVIINAAPSDAITVGFTARYAAAREYGARGQAPDAFVRLAAQQWQRVCTEAATEAQKGATK